MMADDKSGCLGGGYRYGNSHLLEVIERGHA